MTEGEGTKTGAWGDQKTQFFFEITPERVLEAVEAGGFQCTGRCLQMNSFENRVYDVELDLEDGPRQSPFNRRIVKFYRPGRWTREQILEEHEFLADLRAAEIPAIAPLPFPDGTTLKLTPQGEIWYALFPKVGGRAPDELTDDQLRRIGMLLARIHNVGAIKNAAHRIELTPATYGLQNLDYLLTKWVPLEFRSKYESTVRELCAIVEPWFKAIAPQAVHRVHGDCHLGNLLWNQEGPFFLDFDDMVRAPAVQDIWLLTPGRDEDAVRQRMVLLEGYEDFRSFDRTTLRLIEPLRALRFVHYTAWVARRWEDPAFPAAFPEFGSHHYWAGETHDLEEQLRLIKDAHIQHN
jgi:Ser/Thr protein kinase RdoA (MazF antagonist)